MLAWIDSKLKERENMEQGHVYMKTPSIVRLVVSFWERELGGGISQLETNVHSVSNGFGQGRVISS